MLELDTTQAAYDALNDGRRKAHAVPLERLRGRVPVPNDYVNLRVPAGAERVSMFMFARVTWVEVCEGVVVLSLVVKASTMRMPAVVPTEG